MYVYLTGYWTHEDDCKHHLVNEKHYTKSQFADLISEVILRCYKEDDTVAENKKNILYRGPHVSDYYLKMIEILKNEFDFKELEIKTDFLPFGYANITDFDDWGDQVAWDQDLKLVREKITNHINTI